MQIDETVWPLPSAFNIREGSPFGRSADYSKGLRRSAASSAKGIKTAAAKSKTKGRVEHVKKSTR